MHTTCTHVNRENAVYVLIVHIVRVLHACMVNNIVTRCSRGKDLSQNAPRMNSNKHKKRFKILDVYYYAICRYFYVHLSW